MSALARLAVAIGYRVSGTDRDDSATLAALRALGVHAVAGHRADAVPADTATLVVSTAIAGDNPELAEAARRGIPVIHRADLLAELMAGRRGLAVAGAHGKSTTSAMLRLALGGASACIGATVEGGGGTGAVWGDGPWFVAEADESDRSLLRLRPEAVILLNVDHDHHSTYASIEEVEETFAGFLDLVPADGVVVAGPDPRAWALARASGRPHRLVGEGEGSWGAVDRSGDGPAVLRLAGGREVTLRLAVPGAHNAANAACAIALADWCGEDPQAAADRLASFTGVGRRYEMKGTAGGVTVIDDYAHHPAEVAATLSAARERHPGRIVAVFQPHLYSRTRELWAQLGEALGAADIALVTEIYAAREAHDPAVSGRMVADAVPGPATARFTPTLADARAAVLELARPGDLVLTLGAGDVTGLGQELLPALQNQYGNGDSPGGARPPA